MPKNRSPSSYYFKNLTSAPFHRNVDRIGQINLNTFDPFVPESRQTVANCKKHRSQRHNLSDKCKHVLAIVDSQEGLLAVKPMAVGEGISSQGGVQQKTEISVKFGDGIPETAKEYIKNWIEQSGMVNKPYSRQYDIHNLRDENAHGDKPYVVMMAPFEELSKLQEKQLPQLFASFNENPREFSKKYKVGNVRIYSVDKVTGEDDAMGFKNYLPIKIVGKEIIGKNLKKSNEIIKAAGAATMPQSPHKPTPGVYADGELLTTKDKTEMSPEESAKQEGYERKAEHIKRQLIQIKLNARKIEKLKNELADPNIDDIKRKEINNKLKNFEGQNIKAKDVIFSSKEFLREHMDKDKVEKLVGPLEDEYDRMTVDIAAAERKRTVKENHQRQRKIISDLVNPKNNLAENRGKSGTDPIGRALQVVETGAKSGANVINYFKERSNLKEKQALDELEYNAKEKKREIEQAKKQPGNTRIDINSEFELDEDEVEVDGRKFHTVKNPEDKDLSDAFKEYLKLTPEEQKEKYKNFTDEQKNEVNAYFNKPVNTIAENVNQYQNSTVQRNDEKEVNTQSNIDNVKGVNYSKLIADREKTYRAKKVKGPEPLGYSKNSVVDFNTGEKKAVMTKSEKILKKLMM